MTIVEGGQNFFFFFHTTWIQSRVRQPLLIEDQYKNNPQDMITVRVTVDELHFSFLFCLLKLSCISVFFSENQLDSNEFGKNNLHQVQKNHGALILFFFVEMERNGCQRAGFTLPTVKRFSPTSGIGKPSVNRRKPLETARNDTSNSKNQ